MGKRRNRQADVIDDTNGSNNVLLSESSEEARIGESKCQHVKKAINFSHVCKILKNKGLTNTCSTCKSSNSSAIQMDDGEGFADVSPSLWICLKCGNQACGRSCRKHAEEHYNTPHSDSHCVAMEIHHQWRIHCYVCQIEVSPDSNKQLLQIVEYIKKFPITTPPPIENIAQNTAMINHKQTDKEVSLSDLTRVRGLRNFGNTCFFNSVLQCLAQTPYLVEVLEDLRKPGEKFILPGGPFKICGENNDESDEEILSSIEGSLQEWGSFTSILCKTLIEMQNSPDNNVDRPFQLLNEFKKKTSQCMDGGQHDSHELLRHLLETVRSEDLKRYQSIILKEFGLSEKKKPKNLDSIQKAQIKFYGNQATSRLLGPDPVFRGTLVSTLECLHCHHSSQRTESFLDLSLPVMVDKPQPPITKRKNCIEDNDVNIMNSNVPSIPPLSKHQLKKERKAIKQNRKNRRHRNSLSNSNNNVEPSLSNNSILEENQESNDEINSEPDDVSDADIEDNIEGEPAPMPEVNESGYRSEKTAYPSPTELAIVSPLHSPVIKNTFSEAETDECRSSPETEHPIHQHQSSNANNIDEVTTGLSKFSTANNRTLSPSPTRYPTIEGDFSIESCLNQFTALELMSGSNKVSCEACTDRENKKNIDNTTSSKMICTPSSKQYLISRVPPVLILHLKRFQSQRYNGFCKVTKHVTFPMILDLAPVCKNHKRPKLYSLYGLVVHSGTLHGGHYVAYVKARKPLTSKDRRWSFLPKKGANESEEGKLCDYPDTQPDVDPNLNATVEPPPGQWYSVSDSSVVAVSEDTVLKQQAYLLFYERIL